MTDSAYARKARDRKAVELVSLLMDRVRNEPDKADTPEHVATWTDRDWRFAARQVGRVNFGSDARAMVRRLFHDRYAAHHAPTDPFAHLNHEEM